MSKHPLRHDKTCLNCRHVVEKRYCPNCGQENTATRKTFYELFVHFFEDLTHYENAFWKTIRNLLLRPSSLTKEYLSGKRMSYLAPVRLYIFISFMTFLIIGVLTPYAVDDKKTDKDTVSMKMSDSIRRETDRENQRSGFMFGDYESVRQLDSSQAAQPDSMKLNRFEYKIERKLAEINEKSPREKQEAKERFVEAIKHNIPKAIFLYMPFFAFALWMFHGKRRWYYFDHGIFTLHYFSFLLLTYTLVFVITFVLEHLLGDMGNVLNGFLVMTMFGWWFFYFFRSHRLFYGESKLVSRLKGLGLFFLNLIAISLFIFGLVLYSLLNLH